MLTPGIAGGVTMLIANALWVAFSLPPRWTSLVLSFLLGLLVFVATRVPLWQRAVYYLLNSLIIFSVSIGTNYVGVGLTHPPAQQSNAMQPSPRRLDRKSTRLNSSHTVISYAVFCLKKKIMNNRDLNSYYCLLARS